MDRAKQTYVQELAQGFTRGGKNLNEAAYENSGQRWWIHRCAYACNAK